MGEREARFVKEGSSSGESLGDGYGGLNVKRRKMKGKEEEPGVLSLEIVIWDLSMV